MMEMLKRKFLAPKKDDKRAALLKSIKPYLSSKRQESIDSISQMLGMLGMLENMQSKPASKPKSSTKKRGAKK